MPSPVTHSPTLRPGQPPVAATPPPMRIGGRTFRWGERTYLMGILNVTPDSFSGDGLLASGAPVEAAVAQARRMVTEGADLLDIGGESTRPGHTPVGLEQELERVIPVIRAVRDALPETPIGVDTTKPQVAEAALDAGVSLINDIWGVAPDQDLARLAAQRKVPLIVMHNRHEARYDDVVREVVSDLRAALERAVAAGVEREQLIVDPGIGFSKTAEHNLLILRELAALRELGRPILLGTSRKSTIGRILDLPPEERLEGTLATTALGIAAGADIIRVHDVEANRRAALVADAIVRHPISTDQEGTPA
jgi:dihydropteroate synthase